MLVGVVLMVNLRMLGFAPEMPLAPLASMLKLALWGFALNVVSGSLLFIADADGFFESTPFRIKAILLAAGVTLIALTWRRTLHPSEPASASVPAVRLIALASILVWIGVIVAGRLIAYFKLF